MAEKMQFISEPARDGCLYMTVVTESLTVRLNSNYRPLAETQKWASGLAVAASGAVVLLFGLGNGYCLRSLLGRLNEQAAVLVYEPSKELFQHVKEHYSLDDVLSDKRVRLIIEGKNDMLLYVFLDQMIHWSNAKKQFFCFHPQYDKLFPEQLAHFEEIIRANNVRVYTNRNTEMHFGQAVAENTANNLRFVPEAVMIQDLIGKFPQGVPAILVAAGPSLDKNIEELKKAKGRAFIIAVDTAMRALYNHNISPDAVVTIDAKVREEHLKDTNFSDLPLFAKIQSNCKILQIHQAEKILFDSHPYLNHFYKSIGKKIEDYRAGASVATAAFSICAALGFQRIVLVGQDLAYLGEATHAGGMVGRIRGEQDNICYVDAAGGGKVKTRHDWLQYLRWFERVIQEVKGEIEVIDATEGGALIHGTVLMPLAKTVEKYCSGYCDFKEILQKNSRLLTKTQRKQFEKYVEQGIAEAKRLKELALEVCAVCDQEELDIDNIKINNRALLGESYYQEHALRLHQEITKRNAVIQDMNFYLLEDDYTKQISIPAITRLLEIEEIEGGPEERFRVQIAENRRIYKALADAADALIPQMKV